MDELKEEKTIQLKDNPIVTLDNTKENTNNKSEENAEGKSGSLIDKLLNWRFYVNYKRMWPYVKPVWFRALCSMLICIPIGSLDAVIALALKPYMDLVMVDKSLNSPWYIPLGIVAFTTIQGLLKYLSAYLSTWVGMKITNGLKFDLFKKLLTLPTSYYDKMKSGDVVFKYNNQAENACSGLLNNLSVFVQRIFSSVSLGAIGLVFP